VEPATEPRYGKEKKKKKNTKIVLHMIEISPINTMTTTLHVWLFI
jgi:hypothetical protein